jgi:hypothetical protein
MSRDAPTRRAMLSSIAGHCAENTKLCSPSAPRGLPGRLTNLWAPVFDGLPTLLPKTWAAPHHNRRYPLA